MYAYTEETADNMNYAQCNSAACGLAIALAFGLRVHLRKQNQLMDQGIVPVGVTKEMIALGWRYKL